MHRQYDSPTQQLDRIRRKAFGKVLLFQNDGYGLTRTEGKVSNPSVHMYHLYISTPYVRPELIEKNVISLCNC